MSNVINPKLGIFQKTPRVPLASLPSAALFQAITRYEITNYGGNIATAVNGQWRFEYPFRTTWANRPPVNLVPAGTELQATDYAYQKWICDGTYWRPAQGTVSLGQQWGKSSAPLAMLSNMTAGVFSVPGGNPKAGAGMIIPNSRVYLEAITRKTGTGGSAGFYGRVSVVGTSSSYPDATFVTATIGNTNLQSNRFFGFAGFGTAKTQFATIQFVAPGSGATNPITDKAAQINTDVEMEVYMAIQAATVTDTFDLLGYRAWLEV